MWPRRGDRLRAADDWAPGLWAAARSSAALFSEAPTTTWGIEKAHSLEQPPALSAAPGSVCRAGTGRLPFFLLSLGITRQALASQTPGGTCSLAVTATMTAGPPPARPGARWSLHCSLSLHAARKGGVTTPTLQVEKPRRTEVTVIKPGFSDS